MVFNGKENSCPNYNSEKGNLDMSYQGYLNTKNKKPQDPQFGKENFNKICFNICPTVKENGIINFPTYIEDGECKKCQGTNYADDIDDSDEGSKVDLINKGIYEMCNFIFDDDSGGNTIEDQSGKQRAIWFETQQSANLKKNKIKSEDNRGDINLLSENDDNIKDFNAISSFKNIIAGNKYDLAFEECINKSLNTGEDDFEIQNRMVSYQSVKEFTIKDIDYIKRKLRKIITMNSSMVQECAEILELGKTMCNDGIADKTLMIGSLIFSIVGNNKINIIETDNEEKYKINILIDQLGPLIPQAIKNIIEISKEYETRVCNNPSNTTLLLERIYDQTYDKQTNVSLDISPYIDFNSLINIDDNIKFIKTIIVLIVFGYLFMNAANLVIAFLSRGSSTNSN